MKTVCYIARRNCLLLLRSVRFGVALLLCLVFVPISVLDGTDDYQARQAEYIRAVTANDSVLRSAHVWSAVRPTTVKRTEPLGALGRGVQSEVGIYNMVKLSEYPLLPQSFPGGSPSVFGITHTQLLGEAGGHENPFFNAFTATDFLTLTAWLFPLLALLFSYDAFTAEREAGTLRMVFSEPVGRGTLLAGKLLGIGMLLMPLAVLCYALAAGCLLAGDIPMNAYDWQAWGLMMLLTVALTGVCIVGGLLVSLYFRRSADALAVAMLLWAVMTFVVPAISGYLAETVSPLPLYRNVERALWQLNDERDDRLREWRRKCRKQYPISTFYAQFNHQDDDDNYVEKWGITHDLARYLCHYHSISELIRIDYANRKWDLQRGYLERMERQLRLRFVLSCLSPLGWFEEAGQRLCRTSAHDCLTYMEEVRDYRFRVLDFFRDNKLFGSLRYFTTQQESELSTPEALQQFDEAYQRMSDEEKRAVWRPFLERPLLDISALPRFRQQEAGIRETGRWAAGTLLAYAALMALLAGVAIRRMKRYDVR